MRRKIRPVLQFFAVAIAVAFCSMGIVHGQNREAHVISARSGGVNFVSGAVTARRRSEVRWQSLTTKDNLDAGDVLKTGPDGRIEVLLNPGSFVRLAENSELELADASLDNLRLKLIKGSAVVEASGFDNISVLVTVDAPQTKVSIIRSGLYRINVLPAGVTEVIVRKGRALVGPDPGVLVKGGKKARFGGMVTDVVKYEKKEKDALDEWSKERADMVAEANRKLSRRSVNALLATTAFDSLWSIQSSSYRPSGVWVYNGGRSCYTFVPFYAGWSSPYGRSYDNSLMWSGGYAPSCNGCRGTSTYNRQPVLVDTRGSIVGNNSMSSSTPNASSQGPTAPSSVERSEPSPREFSRPSKEDVQRERPTRMRGERSITDQ
ncbi:MAG: FecR domain-containing protein [Pyrinomonadaceae bacterium]|nr:FecR domain-containing protein [Pyrinomonadaceae bacterium]